MLPQRGITPRYEFGFGLSYTTFKITPKGIKIERKKLSALPFPRPAHHPPPKLSEDIPPTSEAYFPQNFKRIKKYIYPYIDPTTKITPGPYSYPADYHTPRPASQAGGGEGGNPSLYETIATVDVEVENTGPVKGKEVVQLYVGMPEKVAVFGSKGYVDFPVRVLRGFEKVELEPGEKKTVRMGLRRYRRCKVAY